MYADQYSVHTNITFFFKNLATIYKSALKYVRSNLQVLFASGLSIEMFPNSKFKMTLAQTNCTVKPPSWQTVCTRGLQLYADLDFFESQNYTLS